MSRPILSKRGIQEQLESRLASIFTQKFMLLCDARELIALTESLCSDMDETVVQDLQSRVEPVRELLQKLA